jgi:hypothetical protein
MALSEEFEADELQEAKERFFREAETAGRLTHPNIVTIYDAGEEHDLCFIAMEFLKGKDLAPYTKQPNLLPIDKTLFIVERVADALSYAHTMGIVHRDIKPANIMYEPESDTVKVTDFGIARITDSSRTKTGMVLGTPSYMSPEQLTGPQDRRALGHLLARRHPLPAPRGTPALRGRIDDAAHVRDRQHAAAADPGIQPGASRVGRRAHRARPRQGLRAALPDRGRARRGDPPGAQVRHGRRQRECRCLTPQRPREPLHRRSIEIHGYKRDDGLFDIEGHLVDTKSIDFKLAAGIRRRASRSTRCGCASPSTATS